MNEKRLNRIASEMKKVISELLLESIKDPRITDMTTISHIKVSKDLGHANIFISVLGDDRQKSETIKGLENAKGFIKKELGDRLDLRHIPELHFEIDETVENAMHIEMLIRQIKDKEDVTERN